MALKLNWPRILSGDINQNSPMVFLRNLSYRNKLFLAVMALVFLISAMLSFSVWAMVSPYLENQIKESGAQLAQRLAWKARAHILNRDSAKLTDLVFDEKYHENSVSFILVIGQGQKVLAHTFLGDEAAHIARQHSRQQLMDYIATLNPKETINLRQEVREGLNQVGLIIMGIKKSHINRVLNRLHLLNAVFIACLIAVGLVLSFYLSRYITKPIRSLTKIADRLSQGDFSASDAMVLGPHCWTIQKCTKVGCPAYGAKHLRCWFIEDTRCGTREDADCSAPFPEKLNVCMHCKVYRILAGDETSKLYDAFAHMTHRLHSSQSDLRLSEMKYRELFDRSPLAIFVLEQRSLKIIDANAWALDQYGFSLAQLGAMSFLDLVEKEDVPRVKEALTGLDPAKRLHIIDKLLQHRGNGATFYATMLASLPLDTDPGNIIVTCSDVTAIVEAESRTIQSAKMATLGEMSAGVAHELNQPLNAIRVGSEYLHLMVERGQIPPLEELAEVDEVFREQVERAASIIRHLREFGRQSSGQMDLVDINRSIQGVFSLVGRQLELQGVSVILDLSQDLPRVWGDHIRLEQVFMNLVVNARDALRTSGRGETKSDQGCIKLKSSLEDGLITVRVIDNGPGIPEHAREKVFQPFFTTKPVGKGTGLGLSISYGIVRGYGGSITLDCPAEGGAVFTITFPAAR